MSNDKSLENLFEWLRKLVADHVELRKLADLLRPPLASWTSTRTRAWDTEGRLISETRKRRIDAEEIIAIGGVLIALVFAVGMVSGLLPINKLTVVSGLSLTGCAAGAAAIVKARRKDGHSPWFERIIWSFALLLLAAAFAVYVWWT
jgi:hypothetical protein